MICNLCDKVMYVEQQPIHYDCMSRRENVLIDMIFTLHSELDSMKKSFKSMDSIFNNIAEALNMNLNSSECEIEPSSISPRSLRPSTVQKSKAIKKSRKKDDKTTSDNSPSPSASQSSLVPVSPLVISNGTSTAQNITVTRHNKKTSTVNDTMQSRSSSTTTDDMSKSNLLSMNAPILTLSSPPKSIDLPPEEACGITVVPPPKSIFLSRLGVDVSTDQVEKFIKAKIPNAIDITIRKMLFRTPRIYSSFVINTGHNMDIFNIVVNQSFWPDLTVVKEFRHFLRPPRELSNLQ